MTSEAGHSLRRYFAFALAAFGFGYAFVLRVSPSVMVTDLMRDFAVGAAVLGNLSACYFYTYAALQLPIGVLADRIGIRYLLTYATGFAALGCGLFAISLDIWLAYSGRLLIGIGCAAFWVGALTIAAQWFPARHFGFMTGIVLLVGMLGEITGQAPTGVLVDSFGWRTAVAVLGCIGLVLAVLAYSVVRDKPALATAASDPMLAQLRGLLANRQTLLNCVVGFTYNGPLLAFAGLWGVPFLVASYGYPRAEAAAMISLCFVGWAIGGPLAGWLSDRLQRRKPPLLAGGILAVVSFVAAIYGTDWSTVMLAVLFIASGIGGGSMVVTYSLAREWNSSGSRGACLGLVNTCVVVSGALLQPFVGALLDLQWQGEWVDGARVYSDRAYRWALISLPMLTTLGVLCTCYLKESFGKQQVV